MAGRLPQPGEVFAERYRIRRRLAAGGMGTLFEAEEQLKEGARRVALKLLHPELASDEEMHRRFRREGSVLHALEHPAVVRVFDVGQDSHGRPYTAMELLEGETLHARIARGPLPLTELDVVMEGVAGGLQAAHDHGVLHADLKPPNVFLSHTEGAVAVKLVDFGTSKVHGLERLTRTGEVVGTPTYMAPELLTGSGGEIDERIDVYGFGVLLYESLTGTTPFTERNPGKLLFQIAMGKGVPLAERRPELPEPLVNIVRQAMAPRRDHRFGSARALAKAWKEARR